MSLGDSMRALFFLAVFAWSFCFCSVSAAQEADEAGDFGLAPPQVKLWLNAGVRISPEAARVPVKWHFHMFMPNLVTNGGRAPWLYTGPSWQVNDQFNIELVGGMGTGIGDDARGVAPVAGAWFTWTPPKGWLIWSDVEWWGIAGDQALFGVAIVSKRIRESPVSLGIETWGIWTLQAPEHTTLFGGPNINLKLGDHFSVRTALLLQGNPASSNWAIGPAVFLNINP